VFVGEKERRGVVGDQERKRGKEIRREREIRSERVSEGRVREQKERLCGREREERASEGERMSRASGSHYHATAA
jgi:hypothetical protein